MEETAVRHEDGAEQPTEEAVHVEMADGAARPLIEVVYRHRYPARDADLLG
jgi:hypothetical protein